MFDRQVSSLETTLGPVSGTEICNESLVSSATDEYVDTLVAVTKSMYTALKALVPDVPKELEEDIGIVVHELGMNAAKYGNKFERKAVGIRAYRCDETLCILISDSGQGIDPSQIPARVEPEEESTDEILARINTSQFELDLNIIPENPSECPSSGVALDMIQGLRSYAGMYVQAGVGEVRVDLNIHY